MHSSTSILWTFLGSLFILRSAYSWPWSSPELNGVNFDSSCDPYMVKLSIAMKYARNIVLSGMHEASDNLRHSTPEESETDVYRQYFRESEREAVGRVFRNLLAILERNGPVTVNFTCSYTGSCGDKKLQILADLNQTTKGPVNLCRYQLNRYAKMNPGPCGDPFGQMWAIVIINALLHNKQLVYPTKIYDLATDYETIRTLRNGELHSASPESEREQLKPSANAASYLYLAIHPLHADRYHPEGCYVWTVFLNENFGKNYLDHLGVDGSSNQYSSAPRVLVPLWDQGHD